MHNNNLQSLYARLFIDLQDYITDTLPDIRWCDGWWGQEQLQYRPAVAFPALLIDFPSAQFSAEAKNSLFGIVTISLRLLCAPFSSSAATAPEEVRAEALEYFELEHDIIAALHGWAPADSYCQSLTLTGLSTDNRNPELRIRTLTFTTAYEIDIY